IQGRKQAKIVTAGLCPGHLRASACGMARRGCLRKRVHDQVVWTAAVSMLRFEWTAPLLWRSPTTTFWHFDAVSGGRPPHQTPPEDVTPHSRGAIASEFCETSPSKMREGAGNAGCSMHPRPRVR